MRKLLTLVYIMFFVAICSCTKAVRVTQQGQTSNMYKSAQYDRIDKKNVKKPRVRREKQRW